MNKVTPIGAYEACVDIEQDIDAEDPREWDGGRLELFYDGGSFRRFAEETFGTRGEDAVSKMAGGQLFWQGPAFHTSWLGVERYSHGVDVHALCLQGGFPDRRWDVSPIVGFWRPDPEVDGDVLTEARGLMLRKEYERAHQVLAKRANGDIAVFNQWATGDVWLYQAKLLDNAGSLIDEDICAGFYGIDDAEAEVKAVISGWREQYASAA